MKIKEYYPIDVIAGQVREIVSGSFFDGDALHLHRARRAAGYDDEEPDSLNLDDWDDIVDALPPQRRENQFDGYLTTFRTTKIAGPGKQRSYTFTDAINFEDGMRFQIFSNNPKVAAALKECAEEQDVNVFHIIQRAAGLFEVLMVEQYHFLVRDEMLMIVKESVGRRLIEIREYPTPCA